MNRSSSVVFARGDIGGSWQLVAAHRGRLIEALGVELLSAFCACFVQSDRFVALSSLTLVNSKAHPRRTVAHTRNLDTIFWFSAGTVFEFRSSMGRLAGAVRRVGIDPKGMAAWKIVPKLEALSKQPLLKQLRDEISFHVDRDRIRTGLSSWARSPEEIIVVQGDNERAGTIRATLGLDALLAGHRLEEAELLPVMQEIAALQLEVPAALHSMFVEIAQKRGMIFEDRRR